MIKNTFKSALLFFYCLQINAQNKEKSHIIGKWENNEDKKYVIKIDKLKIIEYYNNKVTDTIKYDLLNYSCDSSYLNSNNEKKILFLKKYTDDDEYCYEIVSLSKDYLTLIYSGNGNVISFRRKDNTLNTSKPRSPKSSPTTTRFSSRGK